MAGEAFGPCAARLAGLAGRLFGWRPEEFWQATPAELAAIVEAGGADGAEPPQQAEISALMERFPDS